MIKKYFNLLFIVLLISGCGKQAQAVAPTATAIPATATLLPTETSIPDTATPVPPTETPTPTQDPTVFGAIGTGDIQAGAIESVASTIFNKTLDGFVADGSVEEYQIISISVFPGNGGLIAEIIYSVKTTDPAWLADGGIQLADGWIANSCSRFDLFTTEIEYQLKNKRLCG